MIEGRLTRLLPVAAVFLLALLLASFRVSDPDVFFHLSFGRLLLGGEFPTTNTFSFTWGSHPWKNAEWLFGAILHLVHAAGGETALSAFQALLAAAAFALTADTVRRRLPQASGGDWLRIVPFFVAAIAASQFRFVPRPHLVTFVGLALLLNLWERRPRRLPLWFACTGCLWANLHPGVIFGLATSLALVGAAALSREHGARRAAVRATAAFAAGSLANPFFLHPYLYSASHLFIGERVSLAEFMSPTLSRNATFFFLAALAILAIPSCWRRRDCLHVLLVAGFLPLCFFAVRIVPKFLLLALPGLCQAACWLARGPVPAGRRAGAVLVAALGGCALVLAGREAFFLPQHDPLGWGVNERRLPVRAADLIAARSLRGPMYNDFQHGSYLMWRLYPGQRVFQDGRNFAYPAEFLREVVTMPLDRWPEVLAKHRIDVAVLGRGPHEWTLNKGKILDALGWTLVQVDGVSLVYVRPSSADAARVRDLAVRRLRPWYTVDEMAAIAHRAPGELLAEVGRIEPARVFQAGESYVYGTTATYLGQPALGETFIRAGLANNPRDPTLALALAVNMERQGRREEAVAAYRAYEQLNPPSREGVEFARQRQRALAQ